MSTETVITERDYPELNSVRAKLETFVAHLPSSGQVVILADGDVDGLGAAVIIWHYLKRKGFDEQRLTMVTPPKGSNAFSRATSEVVMKYQPVGLFVLDLGINAHEIAKTVPTLLVDHHRPEGAPPGSIVINGYQWQPVPTSSLLTYLVCNNEGKIADLAWVAAIGNLGDLGPNFSSLQQAIKLQKQKFIREATSLLNAAKRSSDPDQAVLAAFRTLRDASSAQNLLELNTQDVQFLRDCKIQVQTELDKARRVAPKFSASEKVALLRFDSPARIHPLLAQSWRGRLPKYVVIAANADYLPDRVSFAVRSNLDLNLLDFLAQHSLEFVGVESEYGHGHDHATGGIISPDNFQRMLQSMGFVNSSPQNQLSVPSHE